MSLRDLDQPAGPVFDRPRREGLLLFLFIPLVLVLLTRPPETLGPGGALLLAAAIIASHRRLARPWALRRASTRSLWSGRSLANAPSLSIAVVSGAEEMAFAVRDAEEERRAHAFLSFVCRYRVALRLGVFLPLLLLTISVALESARGSELFHHQRSATLIFFQGSVALTVLAAALGALRQSAFQSRAPYPFPFPIHNLALLGIRNTLAVFVTVGTYWLGLALYRLADWPGA